MERQLVRLVPTGERVQRPNASPSVFDLARPARRIKRGDVKVIEGELPPAFKQRRSVFEDAYSSLGPGKFIEFGEPQAKSFKRWAHANGMRLEWRLIAPAWWAFRRVD